MSAGDPDARAPRWTVLELLRWTTDHFARAGIGSARLDAECLLAHALGSDRLALYLEFDKPTTEEERGAFRALVRRRANERVPVALLTGRKEFWSLPLAVTPDVLVPRPETETLVAAALERLPEAEGEYRILDVGTGSGAVALALLCERPKARAVAGDVSPAACAVARANAERLGVADRMHVAPGDLFEPAGDARFDLVVSNPPYLGWEERPGLPPELAHEPESALFAAEAGTAVLRALAQGAPEVLSPGGALALELAPAQAERVAAWCGEAGLGDLRVHRDLAERPRVVSARREDARAD